MSEILINILIAFIVGLLIELTFRPIQNLILRIQKKIPWEKFFKALTDAKNLEEIRKFKPNIIIGLNDGIVPASILARNLEIDTLYYCRIENAGEEEQQTLCGIDCLDITEKKVLIIDDQILSGENLKALSNYLKTCKGFDKKNLKKFVLFKYDTPIHKHVLDFTSPGKTTGRIKLEPWSFTEYHKARGKPRDV